MYRFLRSATAAMTVLTTLSPLDAAARSCEPDMPQLEVFSEHFANRGQARRAYHLTAKQRALEAESCACPYEDWSFADFVQERTGKDMQDLTQPEIRDLNLWSDAHGAQILKIYGDFYFSRCAQEDQ